MHAMKWRGNEEAELWSFYANKGHTQNIEHFQLQTIEFAATTSLLIKKKSVNEQNWWNWKNHVSNAIRSYTLNILNTVFLFLYRLYLYGLSRSWQFVLSTFRLPGYIVCVCTLWYPGEFDCLYTSSHLRRLWVRLSNALPFRSDTWHRIQQYECRKIVGMSQEI